MIEAPGPPDTEASSTGAAPVTHAPSAWAGGPVPRLRMGEVLRVLARARRTAALYGIDHPVTAKTIDESYELLGRGLANRTSLRLIVHEDLFFMGRMVLLEESLRLAGLITELRERQIGLIEFHAGLEAWELKALIEVLNLRPPELQRAGGTATALTARQVKHVTASATRPATSEDRSEYRVEPRDVYRAGLRVVDDLYYQASRDLPVDLKKAGMIVTSLLEVITEDRSGLLGLAALKLYDENTAHHSINVAILSLLVGNHLKFQRPMLNVLGLAALLHDIGKVRLPRGVLLKVEGLTEADRDLIRKHTLYGAHLLRNLPGLSRLAMIVAFEHHSNYNLSGYPPITAKDTPHQLTRLIALADLYDTMTASTRPDRPPALPHTAMRFILDGAGRVFDPALARVFVQVVGLYPVGSLVELWPGEVAVVIRPGDREADRPTVKVVADATGPLADPRVVALEEVPDLRIVRALDPAETGVDVTAHL